MSEFELQILIKIVLKGKNNVEQEVQTLQYRTKDVWPYTTVPRLDPREYIWSKWKDVPIVREK